jgi:hypothetical protein
VPRAVHVAHRHDHAAAGGERLRRVRAHVAEALHRHPGPLEREPSSSNDTPEMNERYPGTTARTHGDANETNPAANATG